MAQKHFVNRHEAIEIFRLLLAHPPQEPWIPFPLLIFLAPGGGGKSTLIDHLITTECRAGGNQHVLFPYARLDFTLQDAPHDFLSILIRLRDQLRGHKDSAGKNIIFPRFDLGAIFASSVFSHFNEHMFTREQIQHKIQENISLFGSLGEFGNAFGNSLPLIPVILYALRFAEGNLLQDLTQRLQKGPAWQWYRENLGLANNTSVKMLLDHLIDINSLGQPNRDIFIEHTLLAAFLEDLRSSIDISASGTWSTTCILFLDGFEALLDDSNNPIHSTGMRFLDAVTHPFKRNDTKGDPIFIVIGSQQRLPGIEQSEPGPPLVQSSTLSSNEASYQEQAQRYYDHWYARLSKRGPAFSLIEQCLEFRLSDFNFASTQAYIAKLEQDTNILLNEEDLLKIYDFTHGHPFSVAEIMRIHRGQIPPEDAKSYIYERLLSRFLNHLTDTEKDDLVLAAVPRFLDVRILQVVLQLSGPLKAQSRWDRYRRLTIFHPTDQKRLIMHPIVRSLLLQRIQPESEDFQVHQRLQDYYQKQVENGSHEAKMELAYHALALGDYKPALTFFLEQEEQGASWKALMEAISDPCPCNISPHIEELAFHSLDQAEAHKNLENCATAVILLTWLLSTRHMERVTIADVEYKLGRAYHVFADVTRHRNQYSAILNEAIIHYQSALKFYTSDNRLIEKALTQSDLGEVCLALATGEEELNTKRLDDARQYFIEALRILAAKQRESDCDRINTLLGRVYDARKTSSRNERQTNILPETVVTVQPQKPVGAAQAALTTAQSEVAKSASSVQKTLPGTPRWVKVRPRRPWHFLLGIAAILLIFSIVKIMPLFSSPHSSPGLSATRASTPSPPSFSDGIGTYRADDGETIGISDGRFPLDMQRADANLKSQAAEKLREGDAGGAIALWKSALAIDTNDAEVYIYLENQRVLDAHQPYITLVVPVLLTSSIPDGVSRADLRGAYIAQKEFNSQNKLPGGMQIRLLLAKSGSMLQYTKAIALQIVQAAQADLTIIGVLGWPYTSRAHIQIQPLTAAHIPQVSQSAAGDALTDVSPYFFRTAPPNKVEATASAMYAKTVIRANRVVMFTDYSEEYSQSFSADFATSFEDSGHSIVKVESFTTGKTDKKRAQALLDDALSYKPDLIEFVTSQTGDVQEMLELLPNSGPFANLPFMSGDSSFALVDTQTPTPGFTHLYFASLAYPDEWAFQNLTNPPFFKEYAATFNDFKHDNNPYGYTRPTDSDILTYDAMLVLLKGCEIALNTGKSQITPDDLRQALTEINGKQAVQGIAGQISLGVDHDPINKATLLLKVIPPGVIQIASLQGCFLKGKC